MLIAISSQGPTMDDAVDPRFGRAAGYVLYDSESNESRWLDNADNASAAQGAGIQAAQRVVEAGAEVVLTGRVGPNAEGVLRRGGIRIELCGAGSVRSVVETFLAGGQGAAVPPASAGAGAPAAGFGQGRGMGPCGMGMARGQGQGRGMGRGMGMGGGMGRGGGRGMGRGMGGGRGQGRGGNGPA